MLTRCVTLGFLVGALPFCSCIQYSTANPESVRSATQYFTVEGEVAAANFTRYELKFINPMRVVLHSVEGDADLYFSYKDKDVSYELDKHDASSATCGLDYIDVTSAPGPSYIGVYGHPSKNMSLYRLLIMVSPDGEFDHEPEVIYRWTDIVDEQAGERGSSHPVYIDILTGILEILADVLL